MCATFGEVQDEAAVLEMLALAEGRFAFSPGEFVGERTISQSMTALLLRARRLEDEQGSV